MRFYSCFLIQFCDFVLWFLLLVKLKKKKKNSQATAKWTVGV